MHDSIKQLTLVGNQVSKFSILLLLHRNEMIRKGYNIHTIWYYIMGLQVKIETYINGNQVRVMLLSRCCYKQAMNLNTLYRNGQGIPVVICLNPTTSAITHFIELALKNLTML